MRTIPTDSTTRYGGDHATKGTTLRTSCSFLFDRVVESFPLQVRGLRWGTTEPQADCICPKNACVRCEDVGQEGGMTLLVRGNRRPATSMGTCEALELEESSKSVSGSLQFGGLVVLCGINPSET